MYFQEKLATGSFSESGQTHARHHGSLIQWGDNYITVVTAVLTGPFLASVDRVSDDANALRPGALGAAENDPPTGGRAVATAGGEVVLDEALSDGEYPGDVGSTG